MHSFVHYAEPLKEIESHRKMMQNMSRLTMEAAYLIRDYTIDKNFWKRCAKLTFSDVEAKIKQFNDQFEQAKKDFASQMDVTIYRCLKDVESGLIQMISLDGILYAPGASYDPDKSCISGTRSAILADLHDWINKPDIAADGSDTPRIMVLAGVAGCGKSAIAHTVAQYYYDTKRLGSSFCFSRADQAARGPGNVLSTIAKDIANLDPQWKLSLYNAVQNDDSLRKTTAPARQMRDLIQEPAKNAPITGPIVIVIDALDESGDPDSRESLLQVLSKSASELPGNFRILVTARQEEDIIEAFHEKPCVQLRYVDAVERAGAKVDADIATFIEHKLSKIANILNVRWPNGGWIILLVNASGHLFQWAATACRAILVGLRGYLPAERLENIIKDGRGLDNLYIEILSQTFDINDERVMSRFKRIFGGILVAKEPLSMQAHAALQHIGEDEDYVQMIVQPLGSLLHGTAHSDTPILALHASFFDFLKDEERSKAFFVGPTDLEQRFVLACLGVLKNELRFNICDLPTSHVHNADVPDLPDCLGRFISPHLLYACRFLGTHLDAAPYEIRIREELGVFLHEKLLFWLEVLSLTKQMNLATKILTSIAQWNEKYPSDLAAFARDAVRFIDVFVTPISQSAPHIYLSALPFAPRKSLVSQTYLPRYPSLMRLKSSKLNQWPAELKKFEGHSQIVFSIAYSPDGTHIISGSEDKSVRVWDAETGAVTAGPLMGHTAVVRFVAYSPDGKRVASGSEDKTIRVWGTETGEMVGSPFKGHTTAIYCIAHSPDGKYITSGSMDKTIRVWDAETGEAVGSPLAGHTDTVFCLACSPDGQRIASGSADRTIRVWDAKTGKAVGLPFKGHTDRINSVAYSPDGKCIASGSSDRTVRVWDTETGEAVRLPFEGHSKDVLSVAYFPDGKHLVSGSFDSTIRVWDVKTGHTVGEPYKGHGSRIWSVACSPDGTRIASGSEDCTIRVWDTEIVDREAVEGSLQKPLSDFWSVAYSRDGASIVSGDGNGAIQVWDAGTGKAAGAPLEGHRDVVRSIAYSPDGTCIASGSADKTIRRWDLETGKEVGSPLTGHSGDISSVEYSPDGKCIVSGSPDKTIRIWDAITGEELMSIRGCKAKVYCVAYSPDGKCIVSGYSNGVIQMWNAANGEAVGPPFKANTDAINSIAYSPDGTRIASGSFDNTVRVWDAKTGKAIGSPLKGHSGPVQSVAYSPDGKRIASGSRDSSVRVWDAETGVAFRAPFKVHIDWVTSVAFSPDGTHLVSGSVDNTIRVWEVNSATCTSESAIGFTHDSILDNGWIMTPSSQLLLWVPSWYRPGLVWPNNTAVIAAKEGEGETDRNARLRIGALGALAGILDVSPPAPEPEQPDAGIEEDQAEDPALVSGTWSALNPEPGPEARLFSTTNAPSGIGSCRNASYLEAWELADSAPAQTQDRESDDEDDEDEDVKGVAKKTLELQLKNVAARAQQTTSSFVDKAQQSFDELKEGRKDSAPTLERLAYHLNETCTLTLAREACRAMAVLQHEYEQPQEVVKMLRNGLVVMGGELIDSSTIYWTLASITKSKSALHQFKKQKFEDKEHEALNIGSRIEELTATLERLRRLSILEQDIAKGKDTIDDYHSKMGQADTRHQLLQERFDEQPLTLRITKQANGDLNTEPEAAFVQSLIKKTQALHKNKNQYQRQTTFAGVLHSQIMTINQNLESNVKTMYGKVAKLLDIQNRASDLSTKSIMDVASFTANSNLLSDAPSQNEDTNEKPAVIAKTPQHHLGKAISTCMKTGPTVRLDKNAGESSHHHTFPALEADLSDEIVEEDDRLETPPKLGKKDRTAVKEAPRTRQPLISAGGYDQELGLDVAQKTGQLVAYGRLFISNPDFVRRLKENLPLAKGNRAAYYSPRDYTPTGYTDYPFAQEAVAVL
ncbi:WD40 repeat-like protein [Athelia psychrophila]|uniref:WD40 repeat-like protein n=1 Tax=Athelia psychrophila TaxID=1759441 RepID=A0A167W360_9AGAM|nr:WD40 repeat-like protein [Fibularhizoctonia sp. CBS 109695]